MNELEALRAWCRVEIARAWALRRTEADEDAKAFCDGKVDAFEDVLVALDALAQPLGGALQPQVGAALGAEPREAEAGVTVDMARAAHDALDNMGTPVPWEHVVDALSAAMEARNA